MEWREILDQYEAHLDKVALAIEGRGPWPGDFVQSQPSALMPRVFEQRAKALVLRSGELATKIKERMAVCESVLAQSRARDPEGRVVLVDVKA
ncbi:MAG: hypothetical protein ACP5PJ_07330 [Acidimicrobiales bacterium]